MYYVSSTNVSTGICWNKGCVQTNCEYINTSYGKEANASYNAAGCSAGAICPGCNQKVPVGEYHDNLMYKDRHFFVCYGPKCINKPFESRKYTLSILNGTRTHTIRKY